MGLIAAARGQTPASLALKMLAREITEPDNPINVLNHFLGQILVKLAEKV
jgi:hypothetical protein